MAHTNLVSLFSDIADAIREKTGSNGLIKADDFPAAIGEIETGGGPTVPTNGLVPTEWDGDGFVIKCDYYGNINTKHDVFMCGPSTSHRGTFAKTTHVTFKNSVSNLPDGGVESSIYYGLFSGCKELLLTNIFDKYSGTRIPSCCFANCQKLTVSGLGEMPDTISSIQEYAFSNCSLINFTKLPNMLTAIGNYAFQNCSKLAISEIPASVASIGNYSFRSCESLTSITFNGTPTSIHKNAFYGCTNIATINVPWSEGDVANAPWGATNAVINYDYVG